MLRSKAIQELRSRAERAGNSVKEISTGWSKIETVILMSKEIEDALREEFKTNSALRYALTNYDPHYGDHSWTEDFIDELASVAILFPRPPRDRSMNLLKTPPNSI